MTKRESLAPRGSLRRTVATTTLVNVAMTTLAAVSGILIARTLGPTGRGHYAGVMAWFGFTLVLGEVGQTAAVVYFVASLPRRASDFVATSRNIVLTGGVVIAAVGFFCAPILGRGSAELIDSYRLAFVACVPSFVGASYSFAMQARDLRLWNLTRLAQPAGYFFLVVIAVAMHQLTVRLVFGFLIFTITAQTVLSLLLARRRGLWGGRYDDALVAPLLRYGSSQLLSSVPGVVNTRLDQLVLSQFASAAALGQYAVAVTLSSLANPVVGALGNVVFPRLAGFSGEGGRALERRVIRVSLLLSLVTVGLLAATAAVTIPTLFGAGFKPAIGLTWLLAPGAICLAGSLVVGDILRGRGQPASAAKAQLAAAAVTVVLLTALLPWLGTHGAAIASSTAYAICLLSMLRSLGGGDESPSQVRGTSE